MYVSYMQGQRVSCGEGLKSLDFFGKKVEFTFQKKPAFQTHLGAIVSIFCFLLMLAFFLVRTSKLVTEEEPLVSMATLAQSDIDLWSLGFMFAVENVPASIGTV